MFNFQENTLQDKIFKNLLPVLRIVLKRFEYVWSNRGGEIHLSVFEKPHYDKELPTTTGHTFYRKGVLRNFPYSQEKIWVRVTGG